jgi:hypothetical protein
MVTVNATPNTALISATASTGSLFAITATGNFTMSRSFKAIPLEDTDTSSIISRDITDAIQINIPASSINALLGEFNATEGRYSSYNVNSGLFDINGITSNDAISITGTNLVSWVTASSQIVKTGKYSTLYSGFKSFVAEYFGLAGNFASLYDNSGRLSFTDGTYTGAAVTTGTTEGELTPAGLFNLLTGATPVDNAAGGGGSGSAISGTITISDISKLLRFAVDTNVFNNRAAVAAIPAVAASEGVAAVAAVAEVNYGVGNGFRQGDLIYVASGVTTTLTIGLTKELDDTPMNVVKTITTTTLTDGATTTATTALLTRTLTAPILLRITA